MDEIISKLKTPEECLWFAEICTDLARVARRRAIELRAINIGNKSEVETALWEVIFAYEEVLSKKNGKRTLASRTRQMIKRHGIIGAAERAVNRKIEAMGYKVLVEMGLQDLTFEAIIVRFPKAFSQQIVKLAKLRLDELGKTKL
ncbi:MAG: hypothetical protein MUO72_20540 [Bacteroidales bacterium]|nr:hypothetical protein [Bacteroidales bacterium]